MKRNYWLVLLLLILNTTSLSFAATVKYEATLPAASERIKSDKYILDYTLGQSVTGVAKSAEYNLIIGFFSIIEKELPPEVCLPDREISKVEPRYQQIYADGEAKAKITVTLLCSDGRTPVSGKRVKLYSNREDIDIITQPRESTDKNGQTYGFVSSFKPGLAIIYAVIEDIQPRIQLAATAQIEFIKELKISNLVNYPNPANINQTGVKFRYQLSKEANIRIRIFNTTFELIKTIEIPLGQQGTSTGENIIEWCGRNKYGEKIAAGIYFYIIEAIDVKGNKDNKKGKIVIIK